MHTNSAILLITCPDQRGLVATVAEFLYRHGANILHADQHIDDQEGLFFMRVEWDLSGFDLDTEIFSSLFAELAEPLQMRWHLALSAQRQRGAIFCSRSDHCLTDLLYRTRSGELKCDVAAIISNHENNRDLAKSSGVPFFHMKVTADTKPTAESQQLALLRESGVDFIILARYMQILSAPFLEQFAKPVINIHHSFLPAFLGAEPYRRAHERGVKLIGATSHYVTESLDDGPIIEQDVVRISHRDQVADLIEKGRDLERMVLSRAVRWHLAHRILRYGNKTVVFD